MARSNSFIKKILRKSGLRYTPQRQAVWDELGSSADHRDVEYIYLCLQRKKIRVSRATIYRTIEIFVKNNLVRKMELGNGRALYEPRIKNEHHDHIICLETGKITEFFNAELEQLQDKIVKEHGYKLIRHVHQLFVLPLKK